MKTIDSLVKYFSCLIFTPIFGGCISTYSGHTTLEAAHRSSDGWTDKIYYDQANPGCGPAYAVEVRETSLLKERLSQELQDKYLVDLEGHTLVRVDDGINPPMIYSGDDAWIEVNGQRYYASSFIKKTRDGIAQATLPVDLNGAPFHFNKYTFLAITAVFPVKSPGLNDKVKVHMGSIVLGQTAVQIPDYISRVTSGGWYLKVLPAG